MTRYICPVCQSEMSIFQGTKVNPRDGVTVYCPSPKCPAQEVFGHGKDEKSAYDIVMAKFVSREKRD